MPIVLDREKYLSSVYGGWLGKNIGGTLGGPVEGRKELLHLSFYPVVSSEPLPNDDLDLQLVSLHALEQYGARLTTAQLCQEWLDHVGFQYGEYGYTLTNLRRGIPPGPAGWYDNPFIDCMGAPIRSEIWAMVAPGAPRLAGRLAMADGWVDHAGGEGVWGEVFLAALESAAFVRHDPYELIEIGLAMLPESSRVGAAVRDTVRWCREGLDWLAVRERILAKYGHEDFTNAPQNIAFTMLGWLCGRDFEDSLLKAVNCGYDTDCTAATLGAILGIIHGAQALPDRWVKPIGDRIVVSKEISGFPAPQTLDELTRRVAAVCDEVLSVYDAGVTVGQPPGGELVSLDQPYMVDQPPIVNEDPRLIRFCLPISSVREPEMVVTIDAGPDGPVVVPGRETALRLSFTNQGRDEWQGVACLNLPGGEEILIGGDLAIAPGATQTVIRTVTFSVDHALAPRPDGAAGTIPVVLVLRRHRFGTLWTIQRVNFSLAVAHRWEICLEGGERLVRFSPTSEIPWPDEVLGREWHRAETVVEAGQEQTVRLIVAVTRPLKVELNGRPVLESDGGKTFWPVYHWPEEGTFTNVTLKKGTNTLAISVRGNGDRVRTRLAIVRPEPPYQVPLDVTLGLAGGGE
ncbi:MAG TPA: hypothetical protein GXX55_05740 [Firmicutes bacterium]|nr:hypothetical protein [Bacillota bacterium]